MKRINTLLAAIVFSISSFVSYGETESGVFNITNYPAVHSVREEFQEFHPEGINPGNRYDLYRLFWKSKTEEEKDAYLAGLLQIAQEWNGENVPLDFPRIWFPGFFDTDKIHALDSALANAGVKCKTEWFLWSVSRDSYCVYYTMPKIQDAWYNSPDIPAEEKEEFRVYYTIYHRYPTFNDIPIEAKINLAAFEMGRAKLEGGRANLTVNSYYVKYIINALPVYLKRKFREQGKSFFVDEKTGENPVQNAVDEFVAAFNAPRVTGLKEVVAKWNPNYEWVELPDCCWLTDEQVNTLKEKIYYGEVPFTEGRKACLLNNLGLDKYNEFIEWYNGDSK